MSPAADQKARVGRCLPGLSALSGAVECGRVPADIPGSGSGLIYEVLESVTVSQPA